MRIGYILTMVHGGLETGTMWLQEESFTTKPQLHKKVEENIKFFLSIQIMQELLSWYHFMFLFHKYDINSYVTSSVISYLLTRTKSNLNKQIISYIQTNITSLPSCDIFVLHII